MSALQLVTFSVTGPKPGQKVFIGQRGVIGQAEVVALTWYADTNTGSTSIEPRIEVRWPYGDRRPETLFLGPDEVFASHAEACAAAFGGEA